jgi:HrpA-like RNA helicase
MSEMPLEPQLAKMLLISPEFHCSNEVIKSLQHPFFGVKN